MTRPNRAARPAPQRTRSATEESEKMTTTEASTSDDSAILDPVTGASSIGERPGDDLLDKDALSADVHAEPVPGEVASTHDIGAAMDAVNLERALIDFEVANARVIDLTARLTQLTSELISVRAELGLAKLRISELELHAAELAVIQGSAAYRAARLLGDTRARVLRR